MAPTSPSHVDLLIIGAGPAGLMAAAWASRYGVSCRIIDRKPERVQTGHADGLQPRTLEIFDSLGIADRPFKEGFQVVEICSWNPDASGRIQRTQRVLSQRRSASRYSQVGLNQGAIEDILNAFLENDGTIKVERNMSPQALNLDRSAAENGSDYPVTLNVRNTASHPQSTNPEKTMDHKANLIANPISSHSAQHPPYPETPTTAETIKAKYLIGCDGAHSWTRKQLGLTLEGEATEHVWGVMDIVPLSNFPDIRSSCAIHSANHGTIMTFPRENKLIRLYIQLSEESSRANEKFDRSKASPQSMLMIAQRILAPYTLDYEICDWWSVYQVGQRVAPRFNVEQRIFLAGDAVHTHSPKAGQGMNVSMQDTYNLVWKLCLVIHNLSKDSTSLLSTYHSERHAIAQQLISMDHEMSRFYSVADPARRADYQGFRDRFSEFISGVGVRYGDNCLIASESSGSRNLGQKTIALGQRIPDFDLVNHASAEPTHLHALLPSTGLFRIVLFAGDIGVRTRLAYVNRLAPRFETCLKRFNTPASARGWNAVIELLVLHTGSRDGVELLDLHQVFRPWDEKTGWDYGRVFKMHDGLGGENGDVEGQSEMDVKETGRAEEGGCLLIVRPDQHIGFIGELGDEGVKGVERYFEGILVG